MTRNYTRELREAQEKGAQIVCSIGTPDPVVYKPRNPTDPQPWVQENNHGWNIEPRYSGRECHAVYPERSEQ